MTDKNEVIVQKTFNLSQYKVITYLAAGYSIEHTEHLTGVPKKQIESWINSEEFNKLLIEASSKIFDSAISRLVAASETAVDHLIRILESDESSDRVRMQAIKMILEYSARAKDCQLENRLQALEEAISYRIIN